MTTREQIVAEARPWVGTPFQHAAYLKGIATDCIGLIVGVGLAVKVAEARAWLADPEFRGYTPTPNVPKLRKAAARYLDPIKPWELRLGDIPLLSFFGEPMHFAIVSCESPRMMIHGYSLVGKVCENGIDAKWTRRIVGAYRYRGVA